jgi:hypothetical protein
MWKWQTEPEDTFYINNIVFNTFMIVDDQVIVANSEDNV